MPTTLSTDDAPQLLPVRLEALLLDQLAALVLTSRATLLAPGGAEDAVGFVARLTAAANNACLGLVRLRRTYAGPDLRTGDFILRLPNRRHGVHTLRLAWPGCPAPANDVPIAMGKNSANGDVRIRAPGLGGDVPIAVGTKAADSDVPIKRRRGAQPGNANRLRHGRRSAAAASIRAADRDLLGRGRALKRAVEMVTAVSPCAQPATE